jgi:hypothetical protein
MPGRALVSGSAGFVGWLARLEKPIEIVAVITILATTVFMYWIAGREVGNVAALCLIVVIANLPHRFRQIEKRQRGLEVLNRFAPERRAKPSGF